MENLRLAHQHARRGKGWYQEVKEVDANLDYYLQLLQDMLKNHTYKTSPYKQFTKREGNKLRTIYKLPYFPDRIAQWAIIQVIEPYLLKRLTQDTYSSIPNMGIHKAKEKLQKALYNDPFGTTYCLKLDIRHFYQNINHRILKEKYQRIFKDKELLWILNEIIDSINTADEEDLEYIYKNNTIDYETGIPIGNYLSQYSGNIYLSDFDHWIKEQKHVKYYFRYMDDIVILSNDKKFLHQLEVDIEEYLKTIHLFLKSNWQIFPSNVRGIDYVGYRVFRGYSLLRKSTCQTFKAKMISIWKKLKNNNLMNYNEWSAINSYNGWLSHCDSYHLQKKYSKGLMPYVELYHHKIIRGEQNANLQEYLVNY